MPSGRTHDSITLWGLPLIAGLTFAQTQSSSLTLCLSGGYLFSGLMFGPDLDVYSHHYKRWGWLRWIWLPYRRSMRHRSFWSHGPIAGTVVRVVYLLIWVGIFGVSGGLLGAIAYQFWGFTSDWSALAHQWFLNSLLVLEQSSQGYVTEAIAIAIGLELGALSHSSSDWLTSTARRAFKRRATKATASAQPPSPPPPRHEPQLPQFRRRMKDKG